MPQFMAYDRAPPESRQQDVVAVNHTSTDSLQPQPALLVDGKKFLWDGLRSTTADDARCRAEKYQNDNFEVHLVEDGGAYFLYTRRSPKT
jgi:hypothetical protein